MSIPIWVVDPTDNNNPFLSIVPKTIFVAGTSSGQWYSLKGLDWVAATSPVSGVHFTETDYLQGMWAAQFFTGTSLSDPGQFGWITSFDGITWTLAIESTEGDPIALTFVNNNFLFTTFGPTVPSAPFTITNPSPPPPTLNANDMDATGGKALADPGQLQSAPSIPSDQVLLNQLPPGMTAIRRLNGGTPFQYTNTMITDTIVSGGFDWPGADWVTPPGWSVVVGAADIFYGQSTKANS